MKIVSPQSQVRILLLLLACAGVPVQAHAQNGCVDSPENPTALLAIVGLAGGLLPVLRGKLRRRSRS